MKKSDHLYILSNIIIPLFIGALLYYIMSPDVLFVKAIDTIIGRDIHEALFTETTGVIRFLRFYGLDILWGYAFVFSLYYILGNNTASLKNIFIIALMFSISMEMLQLTHFANGTFDLLDIIFEFLAELLAVFIIKKLRLRRHEHEKKI